MRSEHLAAGAAVVILGLCGASSGWSQEKFKIPANVAAAQTKYTYQHVLDVGDVPGHQVRLYEIQRTFGENGRRYKGVREVEEWLRGQSDMTGGNGQSWGYSVTTLENGDKIFLRYSGTLFTTENAGAKETVYHGVGNFIGGTGEFQGIRGVVRSKSTIQMKDGQVQSNQQEGEGEYWFEK